MSTENEKNPIVNGKELKDEAVEQVTGGLFAFNPDESLASFTMTHQFTAAAAPAVDASVAAVANAATAPVTSQGIETPNNTVSPDNAARFHIDRL